MRIVPQPSLRRVRGAVLFAITACFFGRRLSPHAATKCVSSASFGPSSARSSTTRLCCTTRPFSTQHRRKMAGQGQRLMFVGILRADMYLDEKNEPCQILLKLTQSHRVRQANLQQIIALGCLSGINEAKYQKTRNDENKRFLWKTEPEVSYQTRSRSDRDDQCHSGRRLTLSLGNE